MQQLTTVSNFLLFVVAIIISSATTATVAANVETAFFATTGTTSNISSSSNSSMMMFLITSAVIAVTTSAIFGALRTPKPYTASFRHPQQQQPSTTTITTAISSSSGVHVWRKRILTYQYILNEALVQQIRLFYNHVNSNNENSNNYNTTTETTNPSSSSSSSGMIEFLITATEVEAFIYDILQNQKAYKKRSSQPTLAEDDRRHQHELRILHIGRDCDCMYIPSSSSSSSSSSSYSPMKINQKNHMLDHYFVWFQYYTTNNHHVQDRVIVQVPLLLFGTTFQTIYNSNTSTTTSSSSSNIRTTPFCFIYDVTMNSYYCRDILFPLLTSVTDLVVPVSRQQQQPTTPPNSSSSSSSTSTTTDDKASSSSTKTKNNSDDKNQIPLNCYRNPSWMVQLSILLLSAKQEQEQQKDHTTTASTATDGSSSGGDKPNDCTNGNKQSYEQHILNCFMTFCTIEAFSLCDQQQQHQHQRVHNQNMNGNVMIYTIPTSIVPILLPVFHDLYPDDRHVFLYTGCIQALQTWKVSPSSKTQAPSPYTFHSDTAAYMTPIYMNNSNTMHSSTVSHMLQVSFKQRISNVQSYYDAMTEVPMHVASHVECYMAAIHTLLEQQHTKGIAFLPYVCKIDYLLPSLQSLSSAASSSSLFGSKTDLVQVRWSVRSLLQFITGSKSREMSTETLDAACNFLHEQSSLIERMASIKHPRSRTLFATVTANKKVTVTPQLQQSIETIIFQHKLLLLPNKTLVDTVQPTEHWTLKQATKTGGCACCDPEEEDDDEEDDDYFKNQRKSTTSSTNPIRNTLMAEDGIVSSSNRITTTRTTFGYVDGKTKFAFDPTQFT